MAKNKNNENKDLDQENSRTINFNGKKPNSRSDGRRLT